jgi:hypothetical protein
MSSTENEALAKRLLTASLKALLQRVEDGSATAADITAAHKFIQSCGVEMLPRDNNPMGQLQGLLANLPYAGSEGPSH